MLIGVVSRFVEQKGLSLLIEALPGLLARGVDLVLLGSGEPRYERALAVAAASHPDRVALRLAFDEALAHRIYAGADAFLMPSLYEPCGLSQLYAMRYGTLPIVRATGGLVDTVIDHAPPVITGTGFAFREASASALLSAVDRALAVFRDSAAWRAMVAEAMAKDFSWDAAARAYESVYARL
jgi:starch synthase